MRAPMTDDGHRWRRLRPWLRAFALVLTAGLGFAGAGAQPPPAPDTDSSDRQVATLLRHADRVRRAGDVERALGLYSLALRTEAESRLALYNIGILNENAGRPEAAARIWMRAMEKDQANLFAYEHLVRNLAAMDALDDLIKVEQEVLEARPDTIRRLRLGVALQAAGRSGESVAHLEQALMERPSSNIAYTFIKDAFVSREQWLGYVEDVARRADEADSPVPLRLLHIRLLLERGRVAEASGRAGAVAGESDLARTLLAGAGLVRDVEASPPVAQEVSEPTIERVAESREEETGSATSTAAASPDDANAEVALSPPAESPPPRDFGPDDPRSVPLYVERGRAALAERADTEAEVELRRALNASPMALQPRMTLSLLLEQQGRGIEAREILQGPVEPSPWDFYQHVWRTIRDEYIDPDHNGIDLYRLRESARSRVSTLADARMEVNILLDELDDRWGRLFGAEKFARYLLAPNAPRTGSPATGGPDPRRWIDLPDEAFEALEAEDAGNAAGDRSADDAEPASTEAAVPTPDGDQEPPGDPPVPSKRAPDRRAMGQGGEEPPSRRDPGATLQRRRAQIRPKGEDPPRVSVATHYARDPRVRAAQFKMASVVGASVPEPEARVGYLSVPSLAAIDVASQVGRGLASMPGAAAVLIDLRGNRGGDASHAIEVAAELLPTGSRVATYMTRRGAQLQRTSVEGEHRPDAPLVVLVDRETASAAEMLATALRDEGDALLVGERTAGKGMGQKAVLLPDGSGLSMTRFELRSPAGERWDGEGLVPEVLAEGAGESDVIRLAVLELLRRQGVLPR